jgi:hypothetical protein
MPQQTLAKQKATFVKFLRISPNITLAAKAAGIGRQHSYDLRKKDKAFDAACNEAIESAVDALEQVAWDRVMQGDEEFVVSQGRIVNGPDKEPLKVRKRSDLLTITLLKAHRADKYRDRQTITHEGGIDTTGAKDKLRNRLAKHAGGRK